MKALAIIASLLITACNATITVHPDGTCEIKTARTIAASCNGATIVTGKVALSDETIQILAGQLGKVYLHGAPNSEELQ